MLEMVQQASLRIDSLVELSRGKRHCRALQLSMTCVWTSSPVTMLPTALNAAWTTFNEPCINNSTNRGHTEASIIFWIFSLGPSLRYDMAQQASANTSVSALNNNAASMGNAGSTFIKSTGGFLPLHKFDKHQTAFRVIVKRHWIESILKHNTFFVKIIAITEQFY